MAPPEVIATSIKPAADGTGWILRLFNAGNSPANAKVLWRSREKVTLFVSNLFEERKEQVQAPIPLPVSGIVTLKIEKR